MWPDGHFRKEGPHGPSAKKKKINKGRHRLPQKRGSRHASFHAVWKKRKKKQGESFSKSSFGFL
jgi:hypothetical protein